MFLSFVFLGEYPTGVRAGDGAWFTVYKEFTPVITENRPKAGRMRLEVALFCDECGMRYMRALCLLFA